MPVQESRFFDSVGGDKKYPAEAFAEFWREFLGTGIKNGGTNLQVTADGTGMYVDVDFGFAMVKGYSYWLKDDSNGKYRMQITASNTQPRYDRIVLRLDKSLATRSIVLSVKAGIAAASPEPPQIERIGNIYEVSLAKVHVTANTLVIQQAEITDERLDQNVCGLIDSLITLDTAQLLTIFNAFMEEIQSQAPVLRSDGGWIPSPPLTFVSADGPIQICSSSGNYTSALYEGIKLKYNQTQAITSYWPFDTNSADLKGLAVMSNIGTPTYSAGKFSNALTLNGSSQALSITDAAAFKPTTEFTVGCWIKTSNIGNIFQSYNYLGGLAYGFRLYSNNNALVFLVGNGSVSNIINGLTNICDGNWHYIVATYRNNYAQLYVDGKLDASGYMIAPGYNATNYVRIGVQTYNATNATWFNGQIDDLFFISGYALDENTIKAKYIANTAQGISDLTLTKMGIVTKSVYSAGTTTATIYSGNDYTMVNAAISSPFYSQMKSPIGFPLNTDKWTVFVIDTIGLNQSNPVGGTWYGVNNLKIEVPIGIWRVTCQASPSVGTSTNVIETGYNCALSTNINALSNVHWKRFAYIFTSTNDNKAIYAPIMIEISVVNNNKTTYYLIVSPYQTITAGGIGVGASYQSTIFEAICAYL